MIEVAESCHAKTMAATAMLKWSVFPLHELCIEPALRKTASGKSIPPNMN